MSAASASIETATLLWEGRTIRLTREHNWLGNDGTEHVTIQCVEPPNAPLPITETGYRSAFFQRAYDDDMPGPNLSGYVRAWLDEAAKDKAWRAYIDAHRQLDLFG